MVTSGARGSFGNITQMAGMKGLIVNTQGKQSISQLFHHTRKDFLQSNTSLRLTVHVKVLPTLRSTLRKLDTSHVVSLTLLRMSVITEEDCGTKEGRIAKKKYSWR
jgi:hypothetical protein